MPHGTPVGRAYLDFITGLGRGRFGPDAPPHSDDRRGYDDIVIELNRRALEALECEKRLTIVPGATHLFEEPGTLDEVIAASGDWFENHLPGRST